MKLSEVLHGPETWCQGMIVNAEGQVCLVGGLARAIGICGDREQVRRAKRRLARIIGNYDIGEWNDAPGRTWEEVAAVVDEYDRLTMLEEP